MWRVINGDGSIVKHFSSRKEAHRFARRIMNLYCESAFLYRGEKLAKTYVLTESEYLEWYEKHGMV